MRGVLGEGDDDLRGADVGGDPVHVAVGLGVLQTAVREPDDLLDADAGAVLVVGEDRAGVAQPGVVDGQLDDLDA
ncbi:hypothetical protein, partial [Streptomyces sp. Mg1]|uniref:hypothetical protein n=1 Tax=Streptomyces sp. Mg1 TaxID=465541 RepID=UPI00017F1AA3